MSSLPTLFPRVRSEADLVAALSTPSPADIEFASSCDGDLLILGAGGKMGPTLACRAANALRAAGSSYRVHAASRFSQSGTREDLQAYGVETIESDLWDPQSVRDLPDCPNVIYMVGAKFGTSQNPPATWASNACLPAVVAQRFPFSRLAAFSTGNVYPMVPVESSGSVEEDRPAPVGEYAQSCLGRERVLEFFSQTQETPLVLLRLNYAVECRYGVLLDIASKVFRGEPLDLSMGFVNVIWQGDANSYALRSLALASSPARVLNIAGPEVASVREIARAFGDLFSVEPHFAGSESSTAFLSDASLCFRQLGPPEVNLEQLIELTARWIMNEGRTLGKPTHFQVRNGDF